MFLKFGIKVYLNCPIPILIEISVNDIDFRERYLKNQGQDYLCYFSFLLYFGLFGFERDYKESNLK